MLRRVKLLCSIGSVPINTLYSCSKLEEVTLSDSIQTIERLAFEYCRSLKRVYLPYSAEGKWEQIEIDNNNSSLADVEIIY